MTGACCSSAAGWPGGLAISSVEMRKTSGGKYYLRIQGTGFGPDAAVFVDGYGFVKPARVRSATLLEQRAKLVNGETLNRAVPVGSTVQIVVHLAGMPDATTTFTRTP
jgi:hypothetical protein